MNYSLWVQFAMWTLLIVVVIIVIQLSLIHEKHKLPGLILMIACIAQWPLLTKGGVSIAMSVYALSGILYVIISTPLALILLFEGLRFNELCYVVIIGSFGLACILPNAFIPYCMGVVIYAGASIKEENHDKERKITG